MRKDSSRALRSAGVSFSAAARAVEMAVVRRFSVSAGQTWLWCMPRPSAVRMMWVVFLGCVFMAVGSSNYELRITKALCGGLEEK